jgi:hypothetical protein
MQVGEQALPLRRTDLAKGELCDVLLWLLAHMALLTPDVVAAQRFSPALASALLQIVRASLCLSVCHHSLVAESPALTAGRHRRSHPPQRPLQRPV